ncbi:P2X purinoceptor 7-like [Hydractinia symbiolongicarpus]|uniref:P2X purinoceptor 7-like n=1 Tax=Hydractinia symbiolongicarpus TaxID=13093 RepID=UPI00254EEF4C|nr:P2X purinoceptor 7-like [Hydractinia symbiolongicarpus]
MSSSDVSDVDCRDQVLDFQFEPRKTLKSRSESDWVDYETDEEVEEISSNFRTNLAVSTWCNCGNCTLKPTERELESFDSYELSESGCIISYVNFAPIILLKENLWTALVGMHDCESSYLPPNLEERIRYSYSFLQAPKDNVPNKAYRYAAYRQFTWWVHVRLGKSVRRVIPSCVVNKIRDTFPAPDNIYTGFKDGRLVDENELSWGRQCPEDGIQ